MKKILFALLMISLLAACAPAPTATATPAPSSTAAPTASATPAPSATAAPTASATSAPSATAAPTATASPAPSSTPVETISEMLKSRIVFYLIVPEKNRTDACGDFRLEPIISKRYRTGDKVQDVQIALNMLFSVGSQFYGSYYNALWNTAFIINSFTYTPSDDPQAKETLVDFGGFFPVMQISPCDKHGIKEQIWKTFHHYGFVSKVFTYNGKFFIDQLSRK